MREAYVPFTKLVTVGRNLNATEVVLTDSAGNELKCNYIQVAAVSGSVDGLFFVTPNIASTKGYAAQPTAATLSDNSGSGSVGIVSNRETGVVVISLPSSDATNKIKISQSSIDSVSYSITYGNVTLRNGIADKTLPRGN